MNTETKVPTPPLGSVPRVAWNDPLFVSRAGTAPEAVRALLRKHGQPVPSADSIYQWPSRGYIPDRHRPGLIYALMRENNLKLTELFRRAPADTSSD